MIVESLLFHCATLKERSENVRNKDVLHRCSGSRSQTLSPVDGSTLRTGPLLALHLPLQAVSAFPVSRLPPPMPRGAAQKSSPFKQGFAERAGRTEIHGEGSPQLGLRAAALRVTAQTQLTITAQPPQVFSHWGSGPAAPHPQEFSGTFIFQHPNSVPFLPPGKMGSLSPQAEALLFATSRMAGAWASISYWVLRPSAQSHSWHNQGNPQTLPPDQSDPP